MRTGLFALIVSAAACGSALGVIHDTFTFTSQVSNGTNGSALNQVSTASTNNAYSVARVRVNGTLVSGGVNSFESEARILVTPPSGSPFILQPFSIPAAFGTVTTPVGGYVYDLPPGFPNSHGTWTFRFFESYDDAGIDATWQNISFALDDSSAQENMEVHPTATAAVAGVSPSVVSMYLVPGFSPASTGMAVTMDLSALGGSATQALYDDGTNGDPVAGDHFYTFSFTPAATTVDTTYTINYHATDAQGRNVYGSFPLQVQGVTTIPPTGNGYVTTTPVNLAAGGVHWFRLTLPHQVAAVTEGWLEAWSTGPAGSDTEIGLYNSTGQLIASDDDDGDGTLSALSFGQATPLRTVGSADALAGNGRDGALPAGTYYLAYATYPTTFGATNFAVTGGGPAETGCGIDFWIAYNSPPTVAGDLINAWVQSTFVVTANVTPGLDPGSQGLVVNADMSALGGSTIQMYDDGTHGDQIAGDNIFSVAYTLPAALGEGTYQVPLTVTDSLSRQGTGTTIVYLDAAGSQPNYPKVLDGPGPITSVSGVITLQDQDMFRIHICDPTHFTATVSSADFDSQLFLFHNDGRGIAANDDIGGAPYSLLSRLSGPLVTSIPAGDYLLAIAPYTESPIDAADELIWSAPGEGTSVAPNGPGAASPAAGWQYSLSTPGGNYTITFTGVSGATCPQVCGSADFNCDGDIGTDADIEAFFACLAGSCPRPPCTSTADFNGDGDLGTDADIEAFFRVLGGGTC